MVLPGQDLQKPSFSRKKMVLPSFSREKDGFEPKKEKDGFSIFFSRKPKKPSLEGPSPIVLEKMVFLVFLVFSRKRWFFGSKPSFSREKDCFEQPSFEKPSFSREKDGFTRRRPPKTIFFSRKRWFYQDKTSGNHLFLEKKMVFRDHHLFLEKKMVFRRAAAQKPSFSREKDGFEPKKTIFFSRKPKKPSFGGPSPIVLEKMFFFGFFGFFGFLEKKMVKF